MREQVMAAVDIPSTSRGAAQLDRAIAAASRSVDALCHRRFYPELRTLTLDWPGPASGHPWELWLDANELVSLTSASSGGSDVTADVYLRPDDGPPFNRLEINRATSGAWSAGTTPQRSISITGVFGYTLEERSVTTLAEALDSSETEVDVTNGADVGVGALLRVGSERMVVTGRRSLNTGQTLADALTASKADISFTVQDGTQLHAGETLLIGAERMLVRDVLGNTVLVDRTTDGLGALAAHDVGAAVYAQRTLVVERGAVGTTAAAHSSGAAVWRWIPPALVETLTLSMAIAQVQQEQAGMARVAGSGENERQVTGTAVGSLAKTCRLAHGRMARTRAV